MGSWESIPDILPESANYSGLLTANRSSIFMLKLEDIKKDAQIRGLEGDKIVRIVHAEPIGSEALNVFYVDQEGKPGTQSLYRIDELLEKFGLTFEILSREKQEQCPSGNYFEAQNQLIARLDQLSRNEDFQEKLQHTDWDLIIVDEAHKMSAHYFGSKVNETGPFKLGKMLGSITRHYVLMTATPHNGKEADFQLFLSLLDGDRFYGKFREGVHKVDISDMMRRLVKEDLLKFDGTPLFPERKAYNANYELSPLEAALYSEVTDYVRNEMNRADNLEGKRKGTVGFALTQLQRRLASSPEAIYQSIKRRRKRLENRFEEEKLVQRGHKVAETLGKYNVKDVPKNIDEAEDEMLAGEYEN
jgi:superfamily II DNA or RNA helicase